MALVREAGLPSLHHSIYLKDPRIKYLSIHMHLLLYLCEKRGR